MVRGKNKKQLPRNKAKTLAKKEKQERGLMLSKNMKKKRGNKYVDALLELFKNDKYDKRGSKAHIIRSKKLKKSTFYDYVNVVRGWLPEDRQDEEKLISLVTKPTGPEKPENEVIEERVTKLLQLAADLTHPEAVKLARERLLSEIMVDMSLSRDEKMNFLIYRKHGFAELRKSYWDDFLKRNEEKIRIKLGRDSKAHRNLYTALVCKCFWDICVSLVFCFWRAFNI